MDKVFDKLSSMSERKLRELLVPPLASPLTADDWGECFTNFRQGARAGFVLFKVKNAYIKTAPVGFAGFAHPDEPAARVLGSRARAKFREDTRREAHDPRTWRLMAPGSLFSREIDRFIDEGVPRNTSVLEEFAIFWLMM